MTDQKLFVLEDDAVPPTNDDPPDMMDRYYEVEEECAARAKAVEAEIQRIEDRADGTEAAISEDADLEELNRIMASDMENHHE